MSDDPIPDPDHVREFRKHRRHLPHWQAPGAVHFLTFSLARPARCDLTDPRVAPIIVEALQHWHEDRYVLHDFVVMPDHVHVLLEPLEREAGYVSLQRITHSVKTWTATQVNRTLRRGRPPARAPRGCALQRRRRRTDGGQAGWAVQPIMAGVPALWHSAMVASATAQNSSNSSA